MGIMAEILTKDVALATAAGRDVALELTPHARRGAQWSAPRPRLVVAKHDQANYTFG